MLTEWVVLGGPIIGFDYPFATESLSIIVGAVCRPKYFGARKLSVRLGENQEFVFFWQNS